MSETTKTEAATTAATTTTTTGTETETENESQWRKRELVALWLKQSKSGMKFYSGHVDGSKVIIFSNKNKANDRAPDLVVYKSEELETPNQSDGIEID